MSAQEGLNEYAKFDARVSVVESSVTQLHVELGEIKRSLADIALGIGKSKETNWTVVFSGLVVAGALYAAAIKPLERDIERQGISASILANAVILKEEKISILQQEAAASRNEMTYFKEDVKLLKEFGSPILDKRLTVIEGEWKAFRAIGGGQQR